MALPAKPAVKVSMVAGSIGLPLRSRSCVLDISVPLISLVRLAAAPTAAPFRAPPGWRWHRATPRLYPPSVGRGEEMFRLFHRAAGGRGFNPPAPASDLDPASPHAAADPLRRCRYRTSAPRTA